MEVETFYNKKGKVAGHLKNGIYYKTVDSRRHKLKNGNAYGIDADILKQLVVKNCEKIRLKESDTNRVYEVDFNVFLSNRSFVRDYDGEQRFLPIGLWNLEDKTIKLF